MLDGGDDTLDGHFRFAIWQLGPIEERKAACAHEPFVGFGNNGGEPGRGLAADVHHRVKFIGDERMLREPDLPLIFPQANERLAGSCAEHVALCAGRLELRAGKFAIDGPAQCSPTS